MDNNYSVYKHTFPNGKVYIGITSQRPKRRWDNGRGYLNKKDNCEYTQPHMARAILKYGWDNIEHEVIFNGLTKAEAEQIEINLISQYQSNNYKYGYNVANGGSLAGAHSEETKKKLSEAHKGKRLSEEHKKKISEANKGKKFTEEYCKRVSESLRGRKLSEEHREKVAEANRRRIRSKEAIQKTCIPVKCIETNITYSSMQEAEKITGINYQCISAVCRGINKTAGGYHWEYANKKRRLVRCVETNKIYDSISSASRETGINNGNICNVCYGKRETTGGYHWEFVEDN